VILVENNQILPKDNNLAFHDIKQDPITIAQLEEMHQMAGSYEA
jgi:arsenate reductase